MSQYSEHKEMERQEAIGGLAAVVITVILAIIGIAVHIATKLAI